MSCFFDIDRLAKYYASLPDAYRSVCKFCQRLRQRVDLISKWSNRDTFFAFQMKDNRDEERGRDGDHNASNVHSIFGCMPHARLQKAHHPCFIFLHRDRVVVYQVGLFAFPVEGLEHTWTDFHFQF